jgi:hypothetical protein
VVGLSRVIAFGFPDILDTKEMITANKFLKPFPPFGKAVLQIDACKRGEGI